MEILIARRAWNNAFQVLKDYDGQSGLKYPAKLSAIIQVERKTFYNINSLKIISNKPNLKENVGSIT